MTAQFGEHDRRRPYSGTAAPLLVRGADLGGPGPVDVAITGGAVERVGPDLARGWRGAVLEAGGRALVPGLHDHHLHLRALAAARRSVPAGPPAVRDRAGLARALRGGRDEARAAGRPWVRAVGYHESVAGPLDRGVLDAIVGDVPVRVQDRSGALWIVNSPGAAALGLDGATEPGIDRDREGRPTGRLFRMDDWLRTRSGAGWTAGGGADLADLAEESRAAARRGVTGFTEATPDAGPAELGYWGRAVGDGHVLQRLTVMWSLDPDLGHPPPGVDAGPLKVLLDDVSLPPPDALARRFSEAHGRGRPVAVHCVTRAQTVVATAAFALVGARPGDRIEHGSVIPAELMPELARARLTVVTNPSLVRERGDRYLEDVEPADRPDLYRCASLLGAGIPVAAGTDAPFGNADPWVSIRAATERRTTGGAPVGPAEAVAVPVALRLFTGRPGAPATPRRVEPGEPADLCLLDRPWAELEAAGPTDLSADLVRATIVAGRVVHEGR